MNALAIGLALAGFAVINGAWLHYLSLVPQARLPLNPIRHSLMMGAGLAASVASLVLSPSWIPLALAPLSLGLGGGFFWLLTQRRLPEGELAVAVGDALPGFTAWTHRGATFDSTSLRGKRVLLKFFRGHW